METFFRVAAACLKLVLVVYVFFFFVEYQRISNLVSASCLDSRICERVAWSVLATRDCVPVTTERFPVGIATRAACDARQIMGRIKGVY